MTSRQRPSHDHQSSVNDSGPLFLVGAQRSGTTALGHVLSRAFSAAGGLFTVDGRLPYLLNRMVTKRDLRIGHLRSDDIGACLQRKPAAGAGATAWMERVKSELSDAAGAAAEEPPSDGDEFRTLSQFVRKSYQPSTRWGDKYNEYLIDLDILSKMFPDASWLFLCRHPNDVVDSMLRWTGKPWNVSSREAGMRKWANWNENWLNFREKVAPESRFEVRYEKVLECTARLERWLGIPIEADLRRAWRPVARTPNNLAHGEALAAESDAAIQSPALDVWIRLEAATERQATR